MQLCGQMDVYVGCLLRCKLQAFCQVVGKVKLQALCYLTLSKSVNLNELYWKKEKKKESQSQIAPAAAHPQSLTGRGCTSENWQH